MNGRSFVLLCALASWAAAHPLGNFSISHYTRIHVTPGGVQVIYALDFAEVPSDQLRREWGQLAQDKADEAMRGWIANLRFQAKGATVRPFHEGTEMAVGDGANGMKVVRITASLRLPAAAGELAFEDLNFPGKPGWKEIVITDEAPAHVTRASHSARDLSRALNIYPLDERLKMPHDLRARVAWTLEGDTAPRVIEPLEQPQPPAGDGARNPDEGKDTLSELLRQPELPWHLLALALLLAFGLGALHALEPGHGKTIVAAYLVGSRGTWQHAAYLGGIVTFTHTFSVFCLGLITLFAARFWPPEKIFPILGVVSGLTIVGLGLWMIWQRLRHIRAHHHHHHHHHHHDHHGHHHHHHDHDHGHHHHHHGDDHTHDHLPPEKVTAASLIALGVSGGLVPCPSALVLLLSCVGMGRIALGLGLLISFSIGLAVVLTAIGILVVFAKDRLPAGDGHSQAWLEWAPLVSAVVITAIGCWLTARALGWA